METIEIVLGIICFILVLHGMMKLVSKDGNGLSGAIPDVSGIKKSLPVLKLMLPAVIGIVLLYWGYTGIHAQPRDVSTWAQQHWLFVLILWGTLAMFVAIHAPKAAKGTLQWILAIVTAALLIGLPIGTTIAEHDRSAARSSITCQNVSAYKTQSCMIGTEWSNEVTLGDGPEADGKNFCIFPMVQYQKRNEAGTTYWRFKTNVGRVAMKYRLFPAGEQCPDVL